MGFNSSEINKLIHEMNTIKRALGLQTYSDDISIYGRLSRVETNAVENLQRLQNKLYIMDGLSSTLELTSSDNPIFINGQMLARGIDYIEVDGTIIDFQQVLEKGTEIIELVGSFVQQNKLEFDYTTLDGSTTIVEVSDVNNPIFVDGKNVLPSEYTEISTYQIEFSTTYPNGTVIGELLGGGRNGTDGFVPVKGVDYFDGLNSPQYEGEWDSLINYDENVLIKHKGDIWLSKSANVNEEPGVSFQWEIFVKSGTMQYYEGLIFPVPSNELLGSFFQKDDGGLYVCVDSVEPYWKQIGN